MSYSNIFSGVLFGSIGMAAFIYGKKQGKTSPMIIGVVMMVYPYFITNTLISYVVGVGLTVGLFLFR